MTAAPSDAPPLCGSGQPGWHSIAMGPLLFQGAESKVYHCTFYGAPAVCKHRFVKRYRNPILDERLRIQRTRHEARALERCLKKSIRAPRLLGANYANAVLLMSFESGLTVKAALDKEHAAQASGASLRDGSSSGDTAASPVATDLLVEPRPCTPSAVTAALLRSLGVVVARLHSAGIVHGDLTTSNFICTWESTAASPGAATPALPPSSHLPTADDIVVLDFGLISEKYSVEECAVDLYVLERAIASTHPYLASFASDLILEGYRSVADAKKGGEALRRLEAVRARGRKKSMVG